MKITRSLPFIPFERASLAGYHACQIHVCNLCLSWFKSYGLKLKLALINAHMIWPNTCWQWLLGIESKKFSRVQRKKCNTTVNILKDIIQIKPVLNCVHALNEYNWMTDQILSWSIEMFISWSGEAPNDLSLTLTTTHMDGYGVIVGFCVITNHYFTVLLTKQKGTAETLTV